MPTLINIPSDHEIEALYQEFHTPPHVREHCRTVAKFADELAEKMQARGIAIDRPFLRAAALLHDLVRVVDFRVFDPQKFPSPASEEDIIFWKKLRETYAGRHHAEVGAEILSEKGFPEVAELVLKHRFLQIEEGFHSWEEKLLYYADKRVKHSSVVSLAERLAEGKKRNAPETEGTEFSRDLDEKVYALEKEIMQNLETSTRK